MLRRLHPEQPESFSFTPANLAWAKAQIGKYPEGREASAVIPLLWRAQEQEGWISKPAIEAVAEMLGMASIRVLEVASFYFMFQLKPVGSLAHIQVCGTTSCMICGAEDLIAVCKEKIAPNPHDLSDDGRLSWEEVECLGACSNAPMAQIGKDYYEDLDAGSFGDLLDALSAGTVPPPGSRRGRSASEPLGAATSLEGSAEHGANASVSLAETLGDTVARITGEAHGRQRPDNSPPAASDAAEAVRPAALTGPRAGGADDLKRIDGVGPKLEELLHSLGLFHFDQIAALTPGEVAWIDDHLEGFKGRVTRDNWVEQARKILAES